MNQSWQSLLTRIDGSRHPEAYSRVSALIQRNGLESISNKSVVNSASEVLSLWQVRRKNADAVGLSIPGIDLLIRSLSSLPGNSEVVQYGFVGEKLAGSLFFERKTGDFLGDTILEQHPKNQAILDMEARLMRHSRKSA